MLTVGLTGKTGAGKGEFCCAAMGFSNVSYIDTDLTAREVVAKGEKCLSELCECFGKEILNSDGTLCRKRLAQIAFTDEEKHEELNRITHKYIVSKIEEWLEKCKSQGKKVAIIDAPLLFESGVDKLCDRIVCVTADEETRRERIMKRDGIDKEAADIRIGSQKEDSFYTERADFVLKNNSDREKFFEECKNVIKKLLCEAE